MPYSKSDKMYPKQFPELFEHVITTGDDLIIPCDGNQQARSFRMKLYAYRRTLDSGLKDRYGAVEMRVSNECLVLSHRDNSGIAVKAQEALNRARGQNPIPREMPEPIGNPDTDHGSVLRGLGFDSVEEPESENGA